MFALPSIRVLRVFLGLDFEHPYGLHKGTWAMLESNQRPRIKNPVLIPSANSP